MIVAVEATRLTREVRGIGRYVRALLPRLVAQRPDMRLVFFARNRHDVERLASVLDRMPGMAGRFDVHPARDMRTFEADVFWYPWNVVSRAPRRSAVVVTIHDVVTVAHPDPRLRAWWKNLRWRRLYQATARRATIVVADSTFTAEEVQRVLGFPRDRIRVVLLAADDFAVPPSAGDAAALARLGIQGPFVLTVGAADRRKNLELVDRAMARVVDRHPDVTLALAGPRRSSNASPDVPWKRTLGFVTEEELAALYRAAKVLVMPSTYEGFGLPMLEAMRMGTPVIGARASSLPEVGGDAAAWIELTDDVALAGIIDRALADDAFRAAMSAASVAQSARFTWDETARQTIAAFDDAVRLANRP